VNFEKYMQTLADEVEGLAKKSFSDYLDSAVRDGNLFLDRTKGDLERWTRLLAGGELTKEDFEWLVKGKKDLALLEALRQKGIAQARLESFRGSLVDAVIRTAFRVFL
jgi:hypothetical protein